ncbi:MAG: hypothetical protein LBI14_02725 [Treponema sp.]|jgi:hypothetical protein|nr:hypothetical protein [Treponema sp.]
MNRAEELGFVRQAEFELKQRITQTTNICDQFKRSYSGYSSVVRQILPLLLLVLATVWLIRAATNVEAILNVFSMQDNSHNSSLVVITLVGISIYLILHIAKYIMRILKIANIDRLVFMVRNIEKKLQSSLSNLGKKADELERIIFSPTNKELKSDYNLDAELAKYSNILKSYSNPDNSILIIALTIAHWISGILFMSAFLFITSPFVVEKIGELIKFDEYNIFVFLYIAGSLVLYMLFQKLFIKIFTLNMQNIIEKIMGIFFIIGGFCGILIYFINIFKLRFLENEIEGTITLGAVLPLFLFFMSLIIAVFLLSIILNLSKITNYNIGYSFLGIISIITYGLILGFIALTLFSIIEVDNIYLKNINNLYIISGSIITIGAIFGLFWNGFNVTRRKFSLHRNFLGGRKLAVFFALCSFIFVLFANHYDPMDTGSWAFIVIGFIVPFLVIFFTNRYHPIIRAIFLIASIVLDVYILNFIQGYDYETDIATYANIACIGHLVACITAMIFPRD